MSSRNILDVKKAAASRTRARTEMTPLFQQKAPRLRARRRKMRIVVFCVCLLATAGVVGGLGAASHVERLAVAEISVTGAEALDPRALSASVESRMESDGFRLFSRSNIFLYPRRAIEAALSAEFPRVQDVSLSRQSLLAQAVVVTVTEREAFAKWCSSAQTGTETCYLVDKSGFIFAETGATVPSTPYVFRKGLASDRDVIGQWILRGRMEDMVVLAGELSKRSLEATEFSVESETDLKVALADGPYLLLSFDTPRETLMHNLESALGSDAVKDRVASLEYIDLRFGNRVYYK